MSSHHDYYNGKSWSIAAMSMLANVLRHAEGCVIDYKTGEMFDQM